MAIHPADVRFRLPPLLDLIYRISCLAAERELVGVRADMCLVIVLIVLAGQPRVGARYVRIETSRSRVRVDKTRPWRFVKNEIVIGT